MGGIIVDVGIKAVGEKGTHRLHVVVGCIDQAFDELDATALVERGQGTKAVDVGGASRWLAAITFVSEAYG